MADRGRLAPSPRAVTCATIGKHRRTGATRKSGWRWGCCAGWSRAGTRPCTTPSHGSTARSTSARHARDPSCSRRARVDGRSSRSPACGTSLAGGSSPRLSRSCSRSEHAERRTLVGRWSRSSWIGGVSSFLRPAHTRTRQLRHVSNSYGLPELPLRNF